MFSYFYLVFLWDEKSSLVCFPLYKQLLQRQPIGLHKIFIDYFFFQADQWDCTKSLLIFNQFASSEECVRTFLAKLFVTCQV